jgi:hypothetical protein
VRKRDDAVPDFARREAVIEGWSSVVKRTGIDDGMDFGFAAQDDE